MYIKEQTDKKPSLCNIDELKDLAQVVTSDGLKNPSREPVHFTCHYGNKINLPTTFPGTFSELPYMSTSLSQSPREWRKYFKLPEVRHKHIMMTPKYDVPVKFLHNKVLQYTVPTENGKEMKKKEIHFSLFYFHSNYVVDCPDATALARDKQYGGNGNG